MKLDKDSYDQGWRDGYMIGENGMPWIDPDKQLPEKYDHYEQSDTMIVLVDDKIEPFIDATFYDRKAKRWGLPSNYGKVLAWAYITMPVWLIKKQQ